MDRWPDWEAAVNEALSTSGRGHEDVKALKSSMLLRPKRSITPFAEAAANVLRSIDDLQGFVDQHKRDYVSASRYSDVEKDRIEQEVGMVVGTATRQIEQLKNSVLAAQRPQPGGGRPLINAETSAHLTGVVLVLVERLGEVSRSFDRCRGVRYQQLSEREGRQQRKLTNGSAGPRQAGGGVENEPPAGNGVNGSSAGAWQQQQQAMQDPETQQLIAQLASSSQQAASVERTMREVAGLNQMVAAALAAQAEQIEHIYANAVESTHNLSRGNESLRKAVALNRSSQMYMVVLLLTASALLLFADWFYS